MGNEECMEKYERLLQFLKSYDKLCVAYSGGADSTLLLKAAKEALGDNMIAVIADTAFFSQRELSEAKTTAEELGVQCLITNIDLLYVPQIQNNESNRCYHCKKLLFSDIAKVAYTYGVKAVADGRIADDSDRYRPGTAAASELGIVSPLNECGIYKKDVREISKQLGLRTWDKPTNSCLSTRFPFDTELTEEKLETVEGAEDFISGFGVGVLRFRVHDDIVRIEVNGRDFHKVVDNAEEICEYARRLGFKFVTLDLEGFRSGSMDDF